MYTNNWNNFSNVLEMAVEPFYAPVLIYIIQNARTGCVYEVHFIVYGTS